MAVAGWGTEGGLLKKPFRQEQQCCAFSLQYVIKDQHNPQGKPRLLVKVVWYPISSGTTCGTYMRWHVIFAGD